MNKVILTVALLIAGYVPLSALADFDCSVYPEGTAQNACVVCANEGRFNGHECICVMSDDFGIEHGQCVKILNQVFLRAPACDGPLREFSGELIKDRECGGRDPQG